MKTSTLEIANQLVMAESHISNIGLANGKMGIALNMYHASKELNCKSFSDLADELIDSILHDLNTCQDLLFFNGITGVSIGLTSLIRDEFIAPEANDLFIDMDRKIFMEARQRKINDFSEDFAVFSFGLYLLNRSANINLNLKMGIPFHEAINLGLSICEEMYSQNFFFDKKSFGYTNSVLYFLIVQSGNKEYRQRASSIMELIVAKIIIAIRNDPKLIPYLQTTLALAKGIDKSNIISSRLSQIVHKLSKKEMPDITTAAEINLTSAWEGILLASLYEHPLEATVIKNWLGNIDPYSDHNQFINNDFRYLIACGLHNIRNNTDYKLINI